MQGLLIHRTLSNLKPILTFPKDGLFQYKGVLPFPALRKHRQHAGHLLSAERLCFSW